MFLFRFLQDLQVLPFIPRRIHSELLFLVNVLIGDLRPESLLRINYGRADLQKKLNSNLQYRPNCHL